MDEEIEIAASDDNELATEGPAGLTASSDSEAEELAKNVMARAASITGVKINRTAFLRAEIKKRYPEVDADEAVSSTPLNAGISPTELDKWALDVIEYETKKCAAISFLAGIPGGVAMAGTIPADLAQYFGHVMRVEQKLAYIYGWRSFLNSEDEVDDETVTYLVVLMGVMLEVGGVADSVTKFAATAAREGIAKQIQRQALTKTFFYNPLKKVLRFLGVNLTKQTFAKGVSKVVPVVGGFVSGGMTYASFKPGAERLRRYLRSLPLSGIDGQLFPDVVAIRADLRAREQAEAIEQAKEAGTTALKAAGGAISSGASIAGTSIAEVVGSAGTAVAETAQAVGGAVGDALGSAFGSLFGGKRRGGDVSERAIAEAADSQRRGEEGAPQEAGAEEPSMASAGSVGSPDYEMLYKLKDLLDNGILTQEEFDAKKEQILGL